MRLSRSRKTMLCMADYCRDEYPIVKNHAKITKDRDEPCLSRRARRTLISYTIWWDLSLFGGGSISLGCSLIFLRLSFFFCYFLVCLGLGLGSVGFGAFDVRLGTG